MPLGRAGGIARAGAIALAVLACIAVAAPGLIGLRAEQAYDQALDDLRVRGYHIVSSDYERGWLSARADTLIAPEAPSPGADAEPSAQLRIQTRIDHGPRAGDWAHWPPVLASAHGRVSVVGGPRRLPPLRLEAMLAIGGGIDARWWLPDVAYSGAAGQLRLSRVEGRLRLDPAQARLRADGEIGTLEADDGAGRRLALRGLAWELALEDAGGLPAGEATLTLAAARLADDDARAAPALPAVDAAGLHLRLVTRRQRDQFGVTAVVALERLLVAETTLAPSRIGLGVAGLDADTLAELVRTRAGLARRRLPAALEGLTWGRLFLDRLPPLLAPGPSASLAPVSLTTPDGPVDAGLALSVSPAATDAPLPAGAGLDDWLARLDGEGRIELPRALVLGFLVDRQRQRARDELIRRGEPADPLPPELERQVLDAGEAALAGLLRGRWLVPLGTAGSGAPPARLQAAVVIGHGVLTINGRELPLRALAAH